MNRVIRKDGYCKLLLLRNKKQNLNEDYYVLVSSEDYNKIKQYDWRVYKIGGRLTAATYVGRDFTIITKLLFPALKRVHRVNNDSLDNRRFNIKHFNNEKVIISFKKEKQESLSVKEETKMIAVTRSNYEAIKKLTENKGLKDHNTTVSVLLESHDHYKKLIRNDQEACVEIEDHNNCSCDCNTSLWDKLKAKLGIA